MFRPTVCKSSDAQSVQVCFQGDNDNTITLIQLIYYNDIMPQLQTLIMILMLQ